MKNSLVCKRLHSPSKDEETRIERRQLFNNRIFDEWLTHKGASQYLKVSEGELRNMVSRGELPYYKLGRRNRYRLSELKEILLATRLGGYKWELND